MADDNALSVAKEITLSVIPRVSAGDDASVGAIGKRYGELFKAIFKQVVEGIREGNK